jgi:spermidine synthase
VIPWKLIDSAQAPGGKETLRLMQRGAEFSIMLGANELMNSRLSGSEEALATLAAARVQRPDARVLIGGLGMGFTLRAALAAFGDKVEITVAEIVPSVIAWARGPLQPVFGDCLSHPRVVIRETDVGRLIREARTFWDAILLDVDNGPDGLTRPANDTLYHAGGLRDAYAALRPGGVLTVWSSGPSRRFTQRLRQAGFAVEETRVRAHGAGRGARHVIWVAKRGGAPGVE